MIVTQKITTLAFQLHDGKAEEVTYTYTHTDFNSKGSIHNSWTLKLKQQMTHHDFMSCFSGMCKKPEQLTPEQKLLAIR